MTLSPLESYNSIFREDMKPSGILPIAKSTTFEIEKDRFKRPQIEIIERVNFTLPGHGDSYSDCGDFRWKGCLNVEGHNQQGLEEDHAGKVFIKKYRRSCLRAECPVCYDGWASREGKKIEHRLKGWHLKNHISRVIHVVVSPCVEEYSLSVPKLRCK